MNLKYTYITIALSLIAPFMAALVFWLESPVYQFLSMKLLGRSMIWFDYDGKIALTITVILQIICYAFIAWSLRNLYMQYGSGATSLRTLIYPSILAGISFILALVFGVLTFFNGA